MTAAARRTVTLASAVDLEGFRRVCRTLATQSVAPDAVEWRAADDAAGVLFDEAPTPRPDPKASRDGDADSDGDGHNTTSVVGHDTRGSVSSSTAGAGPPPVPVPPWFLALCEAVILHRDPRRFGLLYRLLWRLRSEPGLRDDPLDADRVDAELLARAVRRDLHKMKAFVRFRRIEGSGGAAEGAPLAEGPRHVAWFEPEHHIVEAVAPFFARRFTQMRWAILTPERCVRWDGSRLEFSPGARRDEAPPADAGEQLWLTYYESIFNPSRLKLATMAREMPRRYWPNLPEAALIAPLAEAAARRSLDMMHKGPGDPARRLPPRAPPEASDTTSTNTPTELARLADALDRCRECPIGAQATQAVPGEGPRKARLMLVGEQPGDQEDLRGRPFVGPAGQLLDRAFADLGWPRDQAWVTNAVKHFKFELRGKRRIHKTPSQQEAAACLHWLEAEIALVQPDALVALGATAARQLTGSAVAVLRQRGHWLLRPDGLKVLVTLHPSALLRMDPTDRDAAYAAWLADLRHAASFIHPG